MACGSLVLNNKKQQNKVTVDQNADATEAQMKSWNNG